MKKIMIIVLMLAITSLYAGQQKFNGLSDHNAGRMGVGLGGSNGYSGLTGKMYLSDNTALQATIGQYGWGGKSIFLSGDFIMEISDLVAGNKDLRLPFYFGGGANMFFWNGYGSSYSRIGVSGVIGLALQLKMVPLELTFELKPTFYLTGNQYDNTNMYIYGTGAVRWYF